MISLTAIIRCKPGSEALVRGELLAVARFAEDEEPGTAAYFVTEGDEDGIFMTYERYVDRAALDAHNNGQGAKNFFARAGDQIDSAKIIVGSEIFP